MYGTVEDLTRFREFVAGDDEGHATAFDFNKLVPMPAELRDTTDDHGIAYTLYYGDAETLLERFWVKEANITTIEQLRHYLEDRNPDLRATADRWKANMEKYGVGGWYDWSCEYWGTKSNACYAELWSNPGGSLHVQFDTAWSFPFPVMEKLVAEFPMLVFAGSAVEPGVEFSLTFDGSDGEFSWEDNSDEYFADEDEEDVDDQDDEDEDESSDLPVAEAI
jgi:hypothetical protein